MSIKPSIRAMAIAAAVLLLMPVLALADSPVGKWSGSASGAGRKMSASATFSEDGSCSLTTAGVTAYGTWSGGKMDISALGLSATLSYSCSGNSLTISGTYLGQKGNMKLSRKGGSADASADSEDAVESDAADEDEMPGAPIMDASIYSEWKRTSANKAETLRLYESGWLYWREDDYPPRPSADGVDAPPLSEFAAALSVDSEQITLTPFAGIVVPESWRNLLGDEDSACALSYAISGDQLTLQSASDEIAYVADATVTLDMKPSESVLLPHISLEQGDNGKAVRMLQQWLIDNDYLHIPADGQFGSKTQSAICAYQWVSGLEETGVADGTLLALLISKANS